MDARSNYWLVFPSTGIIGSTFFHKKLGVDCSRIPTIHQRPMCVVSRGIPGYTHRHEHRERKEVLEDRHKEIGVEDRHG